MTYEAEMKEFLEAKKLPANEGTYPEELMTQITIDAFNELTDRIHELEDQIDEADDKLLICESKLEILYDKITDIKEMISHDK